MYVLYKKKLKISFILLLLFIEVILIFFISNIYFKNKDNEITVDEKISKTDLFAIMLEQSNGTYIESNLKKWPTDMLFNAELSGCIDDFGNIIENALYYDDATNTFIFSTATTSSCYLYFDLITN